MKRLVWFALALGLVAGAFMLGTRFGSREAVFAASADGARVAWAQDRRCWIGPCQVLWIGSSRDSATVVETLKGTDRCDEIVWTKDGSRVAFLIDGTQLQFYDPSSLAPAGQITLVQPQAASICTRCDVLRERPRDHVRRVPARAIRVSRGDRGGAAVGFESPVASAFRLR